MKMLLIGGVGFAIGVGATLSYFSLAHFFAVNASMQDTVVKNRAKRRSGEENTATPKKRGAGA